MASCTAGLNLLILFFNIVCIIKKRLSRAEGFLGQLQLVIADMEHAEDNRFYFIFKVFLEDPLNT